MTTQGKRIKEVRKLLNLSQSDFGAKLGVSKQYVSNLEADRNVLNNEKLVSLLLDLNVSLDYLIGGYGEPFLRSGAEHFEDIKGEILKEVEIMLRKRGIN